MVTKIIKTQSHVDDKSLRIISLFTNDYAKQLHVREIGRLLHMNHRTTLLHLKRLEQDQILVAKKVGRSRHYSVNISSILAKFMLELAETYATAVFLKERFLLKNIMAEIEDRTAFDGCLVLFGSWTKGYATETSDIDLLLIGKINDEKVVKDIQTRTGKRLSIKVVSAQDFAQAVARKDALTWEIVSAHKVLKQAGLFVDMLWRYYRAR